MRSILESIVARFVARARHALGIVWHERWRRFVLIPWAVIGIWSVVEPQLYQSWQKKIPTGFSIASHLPWYVWVMGLLALLLLVMIENTYQLAGGDALLAGQGVRNYLDVERAETELPRVLEMISKKTRQFGDKYPGEKGYAVKLEQALATKDKKRIIKVCRQVARHMTRYAVLLDANLSPVKTMGLALVEDRAGRVQRTTSDKRLLAIQQEARPLVQVIGVSKQQIATLRDSVVTIELANVPAPTGLNRAAMRLADSIDAEINVLSDLENAWDTLAKDITQRMAALSTQHEAASKA
jgi:hypothetical protein